MSKRPLRKQKQANNKHHKNTNTLRIIAGQWRGRKLSFATAPGLRPTPDRVRETLFNWLQGHVQDARCLDLFAGSGALAFEALSRGAADVTLVEKNRDAVRKLQENIQLLKTDKAKIIEADSFQFLSEELKNPASQNYDLIFLDPPFRQNYLPRLLAHIVEKNLLTDKGVVYLEHEHETNEDLERALKHFDTLKEKKAGQIVSRLIRLI